MLSAALYGCKVSLHSDQLTDELCAPDLLLETQHGILSESAAAKLPTT